MRSNFEDVLGFVVDSDKQRFQDVAFGIIGKKGYIATEPISLENGNQIIEEYYYLYNTGDYEKRSPILFTR